MLDIQLVRNETQKVKSALSKLGTDEKIIDVILELDGKRRSFQQKGDLLRSKIKSASKEIGKIKDETKRKSLIEDVAKIKGELKNLDDDTKITTELFNLRMLEIPNLPLEEVPEGLAESANIVEICKGDKPVFDFKPLAHWDIMNNLGIIDFERGQKISGKRFYILKGQGAKLQRALIWWMLDVHTKEHGYEEVYPPFMVRSKCLTGTGNLPKFGDNLFHDAEEDFWMIPTGEVPITNFYREEILEEESLPIKHVAYTPCFRREKMSHGKESRGIKRGHQFDKVEMVQFVHPENGREALEELTRHAEALLLSLGLRFRRVKMCAGELSFVSCFKYDLEVWAPGCDEWLEVSSCSYFGDFQARRAKIRFKDSEKKIKFIHTVNGSGLALPRVMIAIIENFQKVDGTVEIPQVLLPYMDNVKLIEKS